jgi:hypothetical protein
VFLRPAILALDVEDLFDKLVSLHGSKSNLENEGLGPGASCKRRSSRNAETTVRPNAAADIVGRKRDGSLITTLRTPTLPVIPAEAGI